MRNIVKNIVVVLSIFAISACSKQGTNTADYEGMTLMWKDEFKDIELNEDNWEYMIGDGSPNTGWGNSEKQYYKKENVSLVDGCLVITAKKENTTAPNGIVYEYTSARLRSYKKVSFTYGRVEALISLPEVQGMWPAFWLLPEEGYHNKNWPYSGEIDIMEARGRVTDCYSGAVHYANVSGGDTYQTFVHNFNGDGRNADTSKKQTSLKDFHLYSLEWDEDEIRWYCDNQLVNTVVKRIFTRTLDDGSTYNPFTKDFHILLNLAVGGHFDDHRIPPSDFQSCEMKVQYVRLYQFNEYIDK